ncbi:SSU ribosomal protein S6p [Candidatus Syntrophocurvum alkaliphilum]|uniref:Small ribosomal subunit protein bS6 n=1 Tax=Candidatus Syntrophocurvum alkaliphilum TaxID=2293317 RepID=A0A6I6DND6_9FIRM|nr:30S ribosomal protein S6 [Candidatus Syntrophocurvum alkaliphilum]QGU00641.1 SSU ribosomal protein S6p [Candidatus Syntrophocurvum alkaliphilum]
MRTYEMMFILRPDLSEEEVTETKERLQNIISQFGGEFETEAGGWGRKRLAYPIEDYQEGVYVLWYFKGKSETIDELDRIMKISDNILRHIIIRKDQNNAS